MFLLLAMTITTLSLVIPKKILELLQHEHENIIIVRKNTCVKNVQGTQRVLNNILCNFNNKNVITMTMTMICIHDFRDLIISDSVLKILVK